MKEFLIILGCLICGTSLYAYYRRLEPKPCATSTSDRFPERLELAEIMDWASHAADQLTGNPSLQPALITLEGESIPADFREAGVSRCFLMTIVNTASNQLVSGYETLTRICAPRHIAPQILSMIDGNSVVILRTKGG